MSTASPVAGDPEVKREWPRLSRTASVLTRNPLATAFVVVAVTTFLRLSGTVDSDVSWQLWIAHQVNAGAQLYRDIIEVNPPLWFWMALPVDRVATLLHARSDHVLIVAIGCLVALSLVATDRLLPPLERRRRTLLHAYASLILAAMPGMQVGQREQLVLLATIPYAALVSARRSGLAVPTALALVVGAGAGLGFALKHYFLLVPLLLELWLLAGRRRAWRPVRPETLAIVAVGLAYALAMLLLAPAYLSAIVPLVMLAYGVTGAPQWTDLVQLGLVIGGATLAMVAIQLRGRMDQASGLAASLAVAASGFLLVYFAQAKGWPYHALPLLGCAAIGLAALFASGTKPAPLLLCAAPALLAMPLVLAAQNAMRETLPSPDLRHAVSGLRPGETVGFLATDPALAWSIVEQRGLKYPSRYMGFWMMRAVVSNEQAAKPDPRLMELGQRVVRETVEDFRCMSPRRIVVARPAPGSAGEFDILPFFLRDPQFAELMRHYRPIERTSVQVLERTSAFSSSDRSKCRGGTS